ncbi:MAG: hypothetical protein J2P31_14325, partial [Blastocatellia bacterium]|nr:hypothetical protein [Blastocatellia bacterium]
RQTLFFTYLRGELGAQKRLSRTRHKGESVLTSLKTPRTAMHLCSGSPFFAAAIYPAPGDPRPSLAVAVEGAIFNKAHHLVLPRISHRNHIARLRLRAFLHSRSKAIVKAASYLRLLSPITGSISLTRLLLPGTGRLEICSKVMAKENPAHPKPKKPKPNKRKHPSGEDADSALQHVIEKELERGELNPAAEPDQKNEI